MSEEPNNNPPVDLAVIGGGPTGLFGAFYAGLRGMSVKIIDSLDILGGQLTTLYPEKLIYDVGGFPQILAKDLAQALRVAFTGRPVSPPIFDTMALLGPEQVAARIQPWL